MPLFLQREPRSILEYFYFLLWQLPVSQCKYQNIKMFTLQKAKEKSRLKKNQKSTSQDNQNYKSSRQRETENKAEEWPETVQSQQILLNCHTIQMETRETRKVHAAMEIINSNSTCIYTSRQSSYTKEQYLAHWCASPHTGGVQHQ